MVYHEAKRFTYEHVNLSKCCINGKYTICLADYLSLFKEIIFLVLSSQYVGCSTSMSWLLLPLRRKESVLDFLIIQEKRKHNKIKRIETCIIYVSVSLEIPNCYRCKSITWFLGIRFPSRSQVWEESAMTLNMCMSLVTQSLWGAGSLKRMSFSVTLRRQYVIDGQYCVFLLFSWLLA